MGRERESGVNVSAYNYISWSGTGCVSVQKEGNTGWMRKIDTNARRRVCAARIPQENESRGTNKDKLGKAGEDQGHCILPDR